MCQNFLTGRQKKILLQIKINLHKNVFIHRIYFISAINTRLFICSFYLVYVARCMVTVFCLFVCCPFCLFDFVVVFWPGYYFRIFMISEANCLSMVNRCDVKLLKPIDKDCILFRLLCCNTILCVYFVYCVL